MLSEQSVHHPHAVSIRYILRLCPRIKTKLLGLLPAGENQSGPILDRMVPGVPGYRDLFSLHPLIHSCSSSITKITFPTFSNSLISLSSLLPSPCPPVDFWPKITFSFSFNFFIYLSVPFPVLISPIFFVWRGNFFWSMG